MENKIAPFVRKTIDEALGMSEEDLSNAAIQHIREQASPELLLETLEPVSRELVGDRFPKLKQYSFQQVLEEDATQVVNDIWRLLAFESAAYSAGLATGEMTV